MKWIGEGRSGGEKKYFFPWNKIIKYFIHHWLWYWIGQLALQQRSTEKATWALPKWKHAHYPKQMRKKKRKKKTLQKTPNNDKKNTHRETHCVIMVHECIIPAEQERVIESLKILYLNESCLISKVFWLNRKD